MFWAGMSLFLCVASFFCVYPVLSAPGFTLYGFPEPFHYLCEVSDKRGTCVYTIPLELKQLLFRAGFQVDYYWVSKTGKSWWLQPLIKGLIQCKWGSWLQQLEWAPARMARRAPTYR